MNESGFVDTNQARPASEQGAPTIGLAQQLTADPQEPRTVADLLRRAEFWLNKVGIVLFLFGVIFLFQQAIERNWIDEFQRLCLGTVLGLGLMLWGLAINHKMRHFSQVLMGGGIATLYTTAICSYLLFTSLQIPYEWAFGAIATITALTFALALWSDDVVLSIVGVVGGLLTPITLGISASEVSPVMVYVRLLLVAAGAIYLFRGWRSLLWASAVGTGMLFTATLVLTRTLYYYGYGGRPNTGAMLDVQITLLTAMLAFWVVPVAHELLSWHRPLLFRKPPVSRITDPAYRAMLNWHLYVMPVAATLLGLSFSAMTWGALVPQAVWGCSAIALAAVCIAACLYIRDLHGPLSSLHKWLGLGVGTVGVFLLATSFPGWYTYIPVAFALQATIMHAAGERTKDEILKALAHIIFGFTGLWMLGRLLTPSYIMVAPFEISAVWPDAAVIGLALVSSFFMRKAENRAFYQVMSGIAGMMLLWRELARIDVVQALNYMALAIAATGLVLHVVTRQHGRTGDTRINAISRTLAHVLFGGAGVWVLGRIVWGLIMVNPKGTAILNPRGLTDLATIVLAAIAAWLISYAPDRRPALVYGIGLHLAFLGWSWQEVGLLDSGNGFVSLVWGAYSLALIGISLYLMKRANDGRAMEEGRGRQGGWLNLMKTPRAISLGLGVSTLFVVAGKLLLVDLRYLTGEDNALWRIALFLGFGGLFLLISYGFAIMTRRVGVED